jgi:ectoine hydroxylase-related dioxygenase (phytanoyl-CoA dioxygenase family)
LTSQHSQFNPVTFLQKRGYAVLPDVFSESQISALAFELSQSQLKRSRAGARHILSIGAVRKIADDARVLDLARAVLGSRALPFRATLFDKSPSSNWLVAWHQDTALPLTEKVATPGWGPWSIKDGVNYAHAPREALDQILALRVHLDDSTSANGPLRVIPNTHRDGVLADCEVQERASKSIGVVCTAARGDVIAMRPLVIHASSKAENESPRRVLHIEYASRIEVAGKLRLAVV